MNQQQLDTIKAELRQISELIGPGRAYELLLPAEHATVGLMFPLTDVLSLVPPQHRMPESVHLVARSGVDDRMVTLTIPDLFQKIDSGRIMVSLGFLAENLPVEHIGYVPHIDVDAPIEIPIKWVHIALWRENELSEEEARQKASGEPLGIPWSRWLK